METEQEQTGDTNSKKRCTRKDIQNIAFLVAESTRMIIGHFTEFDLVDPSEAEHYVQMIHSYSDALVPLDSAERIIMSIIQARRKIMETDQGYRVAMDYIDKAYKAKQT